MESKTINGLILAAGLSSRMGDFKPLMPFRKKTLIENAIDSMFLAGVQRIVVVLGHRGKELETILRCRYLGDALILTYNREYASADMLCSIKIGLGSMPQCRAFFLLPGDMPAVGKETYLALYRAMQAEPSPPAVVFPTWEGRRKHPPLIDSRFMEVIQSFNGNGGLREIWKLHPEGMKTVPVDDEGCWTDLDTFQQYKQCVNRYASAVI